MRSLTTTRWIHGWARSAMCVDPFDESVRLEPDAAGTLELDLEPFAARCFRLGAAGDTELI